MMGELGHSNTLPVQNRPWLVQADATQSEGRCCVAWCMRTTLWCPALMAPWLGCWARLAGCTFQGHACMSAAPSGLRKVGGARGIEQGADGLG